MIKTDNPVKIIKKSTKYLWDNTYMMMYSLGQLFTGNVPLKDMHGVVAITKIGGDIIEKTGKSAGMLLAALISMNLAILNILPISIVNMLFSTPLQVLRRLPHSPSTMRLQ